MVLIKIIVVLLSTLLLVHATTIEREPVHLPFDPNVYEEVLDPELCTRQLQYLALNDTLLMMTFLEAGPRIPKGILQFNLLDLGNYHQCLGIYKEVNDMVIDGKYCLARTGSLGLASLKGTTELEKVNKAIDTVKDKIKIYEKIQQDLLAMDGLVSNRHLRTDPSSLGLFLTVAVCIPKPCTLRQALPILIGSGMLESEEIYCRFKNDKRWAPGVYVAIVIFSLIALLTILSTCYDIWNTFFYKRDPKSLNTIYQSFSVYTNARRLITYKPVRGALECVDGVRALTMTWVVIGHTFLTLPPVLNNLEYFEWVMSFRSFWITAAPLAVDTFFMLSGLLIVYTSVGKLSNMKLLKNLHLFYLNRILRMFPLLATAILLQVGVFHYIHDGPYWHSPAFMTADCRINWWSTLLYVQNYVQPTCVPHSWYLAIDMQLHILSPLILFWVLSGKRNLAWSALIGALLLSLTGSTIYNFLNDFSGTFVRPALSPEDFDRYFTKYYQNTLTRCSPFLVGMCFGYLIHFWRENTIRISRIINCIFWLVSLAVLWLALYATEPLKNAEFDKQNYDNFVNSFMRPAWALGVGWFILACAQGYGGPVNWFLSLQFWKLTSRLSYAIYLLHYPIQFVINGAMSQYYYFSVLNCMYSFCGQFVITFIVSFVFTILIDSPFSTIVKMLLGGGIKKADSEPQGDKINNQQLAETNQEKSQRINDQNTVAT